MSDTKQCSKCRKDKQLTHFYRKGKKRQSQCIKCENSRRLKKCKECLTEFTPSGRISAYCVTCYPAQRRASSLLSASRSRANKQNLSSSLTKEWIVERIRNPCPRTGVTFDLKSESTGYGDRGPYIPSLDKIDPSGGYTADNVQVVCWWYNAAKQRFTDNEVMDLCKKVVQRAG